ncbi:MAG: Ig-like domain-containing protein [bacterium]|nr:Ig-like domain-containing protein [bacterium]
MTSYSFQSIGPAGANAYAYDINDLGQIVGTYDLGGFFSYGFLYSGGTYTTISVPDAYYTNVFGINNAGDIVGAYADNTSNHYMHGFLYSNGTYTTIDSPLATYPFTVATDINDFGEIVGYYSISPNYPFQSGFVYSAGTYTSVSTGGGTGVTGINNAGDYVGYYGSVFTGASYSFSVIDGQYSGLNPPFDLGDGRTPNNIAGGINDLGEIVGSYNVFVDQYHLGSSHGFLYSGGAYTTIDYPLGNMPTTLSGINNSGLIVGYYQDASGTHSFLATPEHTPDPIANVVSLKSGSIVDEMAQLASDVYDGPEAAVGRNWHAVTAAELNLSSGDNGTIRFRFEDGKYEASLDSIADQIQFELGNEEARALVLSGLVSIGDHQETALAISFRGDTRLPEDFLPFIRDALAGAVSEEFVLHYSKFAPLVEAIKAYISSANIQHVFVAGHSLGGAMLQYFMNEDIGSAKVDGYTWGTPGADVTPVHDTITNFIDSKDPISALGQLGGLFRVGSDAFLHDVSVGQTLNPINYHLIAHYVADTHIVVTDAANLESALYATTLGEALRSGTPWWDASYEIGHTRPTIQIVAGTTEGDIIEISDADQFVLGGDGADQFNWADPTAFESGTRIIDGGRGSDVLHLPGAATAWWWIPVDNGFQLYSVDELVATLKHTELLQFDTGPAVSLNAPIAHVSADATQLHAGQVVSITFTFNQPVLSFDRSDISVTGGSLGPIVQLDPTHFSASFTPSVADNLSASIAILTSGPADSFWVGFDGTPGLASFALQLTGDTKAPVLTGMNLFSDTGSSSSDLVTSNPTLTGFGDANTVVHFSIDGTPTTATATADWTGLWKFTPVGLSAGQHTIEASEIDAGGNYGSASLSFMFDNSAPVTTISDIIQTAQKKTTSTVISGDSEKGATVSLYDGTSLAGKTTADSSGHWSITLNSLSDTVHRFQASAVDLAGNAGTLGNLALFGTSKGDQLAGLGTGSLIVGQGGADQLTGETGKSDAFLFRGAFGKDTVKNFELGIDLLEFDHSLFATAASVVGHAKDTKNGAVITYDNADTVTLSNITVAQLQAHLNDIHII